MARKKQMRKTYNFLKILQKLPSEERIVILEYLNDKGCNILYETIYNGLYGTSIPKEKRIKLKHILFSKKRILRALISPSTLGKQKKLIQTGGSTLSTILETVLPILAAVLL